jgi:hypothetical protein
MRKSYGDGHDPRRVCAASWRASPGNFNAEVIPWGKPARQKLFRQTNVNQRRLSRVDLTSNFEEQQQILSQLLQPDQRIVATMAEGSGSGGIDRKADERMEFSTSKEVTVHPTFESMSLKG